MRKQKELFIDSFATYTDYFLTCEKQWDLFNCEKCNIVFIKIFNSVLFDENVEKRNQKIAYLVFWINFIIEKCKRNVEEPLLNYTYYYCKQIGFATIDSIYIERSEYGFFI